MRHIILVVFASAIFAFHTMAKDDFSWEPISDADWAVKAEPEKDIIDAVMIFEKIVVDDQNMINEKCYYELYRRVRILSDEGRKWADVAVPYLAKEQKIEKISGRTFLPDKEIVMLEESQVIEKEIFKTKGFKVKQKSFSLPAVSNNCIIEYYIKIRLPEPAGLWLIEQDIFLKKGELKWKFYQGKSVETDIYKQLTDILTPNYLALNTEKQLTTEQRPSIKDPVEVVFGIQDVPAFKTESNTLPDVALRFQLRFYYGGPETPAAYWGKASKEIIDASREFTKKNNRVRKVIENFVDLPSNIEKIDAAYIWLQDNIKNTSYLETDEKFKNNNTVDDVLKNGYGTMDDINKVYYDMLRELNIDAKLAFVVDRDDNFFVYNAKTWQFNRSVIAIPKTTGSYGYYNPGGKYMPTGAVAWFNEGTLAFVAGDFLNQFFPVDVSEAQFNRLEYFQRFTMFDDFKFNGTISAKYRGHPARSIRLRLFQANAKEKEDYLREEFSELYPNCKVDSLKVDGLETVTEDLTVICNVSFDHIGQQMGDRLLVRASDLITKHENPFHADERKFNIVFDYAKELNERLHIDLPEEWNIEAIPADSLFSNHVGLCQISFESLDQGKTLSIQRSFKLNNPFWKPNGYGEIKQLFQTMKRFEGLTVVLKEK